MKLLPLWTLSVLLLLTSNVFAQQDKSLTESSTSLEKGAFTIGLNGSASNNKSQARWSLTPQIGYAVVDGLVVGLQFSVADRFLKEERSWASLKRGSITEYAFTPEVYARYYLLPYRFTPFIQVSSGYTIGKAFSKGSSTILGDPIEDYSVSTNNFIAFGAAGISFRVSKKVALQAQYNLPLVADETINQLIRLNRFRLGVSFCLK